jgi:hypothetical protein
LTLDLLLALRAQGQPLQGGVFSTALHRGSRAMQLQCRALFG